MYVKIHNKIMRKLVRNLIVFFAAVVDFHKMLQKRKEPGDG